MFVEMKFVATEGVIFYYHATQQVEPKLF